RGRDLGGQVGQGHEVGVDEHQARPTLLPGLGQGGQLVGAQLVGRGDQHGAPLPQGVGGVGGVPVHVDVRPEVLQHLHHRFRALSGGGVRLEGAVPVQAPCDGGDRKSTRLNSSHVSISYAVFCL